MPLTYAHLEGAEQITLDGVFHSVDKPDAWYGSDGVVDSWLATVLKEVRLAAGGPFPELFSARFANLFK